MPKRESHASFEAAAKHFFRHLHDPHALRDNPLVAHLFESRGLTALNQARDERVVAQQIQQLVREGAEYCRDSDLAAGKQELAVRRHAIVVMQCLEQRPVHEVAAALGISYYHCYRERASICRRIAQYVAEHGRAKLDYLGELDEFGFLLNYTRYRASFADAAAAWRATEELTAAAPSPHRMVEALRAGAMLTMDLGDLSRGEAAYAAARRILLERSRGEPRSRALGQASLDLFGSELAFRSGKNRQAVQFAERANTSLEASLAGAEPYVSQMYAESLFALAATSWSVGNTEVCYRCLARAEPILRSSGAVSPPLRARIMATLWKVRNYLLLSNEAWYPAWKRREGLLTTFRDAHASGSTAEAVEALVVLTEHHAFTGADDEALRAGRLAILLAKGASGESLRFQTVIDVCIGLLPTRHWRFATPQLADVQRHSVDAAHRELLTYLEGEHLLRLGLFEDALTLASGESNRWQFATLRVKGQTVAAAAASALERRKEARALVDAALSAAEGLTSVPVLLHAYRVAGTVTGEPRFKRLADELARVLSA